MVRGPIEEESDGWAVRGPAEMSKVIRHVIVMEELNGNRNTDKFNQINLSIHTNFGVQHFSPFPFSSPFLLLRSQTMALRGAAYLQAFATSAIYG